MVPGQNAPSGHGLQFLSEPKYWAGGQAPGQKSSALSVVLKFPDMQALQGWYDSPEYQEIHPLRADNSEGHVTFATTGTAKND